MSDSDHENVFDVLKSKTDKLHIPLPNFKGFFHKPSSEEEVFKNFIGREKISEQLEEWLVNGDSGSYLVTGYRGIGKSSFVGNVLNKITIPKSCKTKIKILGFNISCLCFIAAFLLLFFINQNYYETPCFGINLFCCISIIFLLNCIVILFWDAIRRHCVIYFKKIIIMKSEKGGYEKHKHWFKKVFNYLRIIKTIKEEAYKKHKHWFEKVFNIRVIKENKHNLVIKLNLGHEVLREKDILSLLAKRIYETYEEYLNNFYANWIRIPLKTIAFFIVSVYTVNFLCTKIYKSISLVKPAGDLFSVIHKFVKLLGAEDTEKIIIKLTLSVLFYFIVRKIFKFLVFRIPFLSKFSRTYILEKLKFLIDRTEAAVTEESDIGSGHSYSSSPVSLKFGHRKNKAYPVASTREIEDELIQIINKIKVAEFSQLKFIIVFDELDKIDPVYNHVVIKTEQNIPEFETSMAFQGGSAARDRKQNVLKLLGNMKMFMSEAKAKFIFISGRELYDAFLADLADREFAASSIFNGVIYVDSFLESSVEEKNILTKTEEYLCRYLIPEKWYKTEARKRYKEARKLPEMIPDSVYRNPDFRLYKQFLLETLIRDNGIFDSFIDKNKKFREKKLKYRDLNELKNSLENTKIIIKNGELSELEQMYLFIDKIIVFLNQFSIYLTYVCNGSPKKITLYLEHFVKPFIYENKKNQFHHSKDEAIKNSKYCLTFSVNQQQTISFVQYITYPIIQSFINQASHFGDKVLVSISFLINHIFKHYTGGFSNENIEHTPELLEVYHIHNLRDIIDSILSFLRRNHVTNICGGVYQYKFRKPIADEIMYNSRISEEISAIFNFTLDESLPVKRYFYRQIEDIEKKYLQLKERARTQNIKNPYADILISQLEILAEVHFSDEEYNEAIQNFQTAFEIIKSELQNQDKDKKDEDEDKLQLYVLLNRIAVKLGKAKECKGYYNEALAIYNNLFEYLIRFGDMYSYPTIPNFTNDLSPKNQKIISKITLFSEARAIYQAILANLFVVEKIDVNGITQENLNLAENQFKYFYRFARSKEKFIQEADFYKKLASILFLKNFSNAKITKCSRNPNCDKNSNERKNHPCYACDHIEKSLKIFIDKFKEFIPDENYKKNKNDKKNELIFLKFLEVFKLAKIPNNHFFILASALRIKADICLSCAGDNNKPELSFVCNFFNLLKGYYDNASEMSKAIKEFIDSSTKYENVSLSKLEKAVLYYWLASEYFLLNHSLVDSNECLQKILMIFDKYGIINKELSLLKNGIEEDKLFSIDEGLFEKIQDTIVRRVLRNNSTINDNTDRIELPTLKYILRYGQVKKIRLSYLSDVENVEEILFPYCKFELNYIDIEKYHKIKESQNGKEIKYPIYFDCYTSRLLCGDGLFVGSTLSAKLSSLEFKERMNMAILKKLFEKAVKDTLNFYVPDFSIGYYLFLEKYLNDTSKYDEKIISELCKNKIPDDENGRKEMRINLLTFLIRDSLYCLTKIAEILSSGRLYNFSNSFIGDNYHQISKWATLYYLTCGFLKQHNSTSESDFNTFKSNEIDKIKAREKDTEYTVHCKYKDHMPHFEALPSNPFKLNMNNYYFEHRILDEIGQGNRHFLGPSYSVAMALKYYHNAIALHCEGKEYREMIREMYIVDDDISNGMHNFSLALERYTINRGIIDEKMTRLRIYYKDSMSYSLINYLKEQKSRAEKNPKRDK